MLGLTKREIQQPLRRDRRVRRDEGVHRRAGQELLVGDVHAAGLRRGHSRGSRRPAGRRGAGGGRRGIHPQVPGQVRRVQASQQDDPARHPLARTGRAVLRRSGVARCRQEARRGRSQARHRRLHHGRRAAGGTVSRVHRRQGGGSAARRRRRPGRGAGGCRRRGDEHVPGRRGPVGVGRRGDHERHVLRTTRDRRRTCFTPAKR